MAERSGFRLGSIIPWGKRVPERTHGDIDFDFQILWDLPGFMGCSVVDSDTGLTLGATDELGFNVVEKPVHVHDLQATILHLLGLDHERLTFRYAGRDFRLTDVHGRLVRDILA